MQRARPLKKSAAGNAPPAKPAAHSSGIDAALVREIAAMMDKTDLTEIEVSKGDLHIRVARQHAAQAAAPVMHYAPPPAPAAQLAPAAGAGPSLIVKPADLPGAVKSPMVGTGYRRPNPDAKAFVEVGSVVKAGDKILLIEAMKTFNDIVAPQAGTVTQIFVEDGQPLEYGQALLVIV